MRLLLNANYNGQRGGVHDLTAPTAAAGFDMDRIDQINARASLNFYGVEAGVFVTNLANSTYDVFRGTSARRLNQPRNWGVELGYRW